METPDEIGTDLIGCARCEGEGHPDLLFKKLTFPVVTDSGETLTHWAMCPTFHEPILMRFEDADD